MRDIAITLIVAVGCFFTLKHAYVGVLLWAWISYMNPHRLAYGFAYGMPYAYITAIVLIGSMFFSKEVKRLSKDSIIYIWLFFILYMGITSIFAFYQDLAFEFYIKVIKIQLIAFLSMMLMDDINKLRNLISVIVISIGYFSVKGGLFTILTAGSATVWGPPDTMIEGNNELAIATFMVIPLMAYLYQVSVKWWVKKLLLIAMPLSFIAAIGTQSRGALIAFAAVVLFFWMKSDKKVIMGVAMMILVAFVFALMPESWYDRMNTIQTYEEDSSAMGRINAWEYAFNAANDRIFGMGFNSWTSQTFALYAPNPDDPHAAHSIYFSVLGDHGWIGLFLFLIIFRKVWVMLKKIIKDTSEIQCFYEINILARMLQVSFIAYFVGGAFLSLSYFDLVWQMIAVVVCLKEIIYSSQNNYSSINVRAGIL